jgi:hypothetical protein
MSDVTRTKEPEVQKDKKRGRLIRREEGRYNNIVWGRSWVTRKTRREISKSNRML